MMVFITLIYSRSHINEVLLLHKQKGPPYLNTVIASQKKTVLDDFSVLFSKKWDLWNYLFYKVDICEWGVEKFLKLF